MQISSGKVQTKSNARYLAQLDPRNAYSEYVTLAAVQENSDPNLFFNFDVTEY